MSNKLFTSCNLCSIPFLGHTDSTRLQMGSKQLNQTLTHQNCEVPKIIGADFRHLTSNSMLFKLDAPCDGIIQYQNDEIMIILYNHVDGETLKTYETPVVRVCSGLYSTTLRYRRELGSFKKGDILYEYDAFNFGLPTYGYNAWTAYVPFFGFNHEDALVVSESFCAKAKSTKCQTITIPIYTQTLFKNTYPNSYLGFIPEVGQEIDGNTLLLQSIPDSKHVLRMLKESNVIDFTSIVNNKLYFKPTPIQSRIKNGKVIDIRIHKITKNIMMIDKQLQLVLETEYYNYLDKVKTIIGDLDNLYQNKGFIHETLSSHYMMEGNSVKGTDFNLHNLLYVIEIKLSKESTTHLGDKLANRYANKGIISLILPDELRPIAMKSKKPIDIMVGPISVIARMNYGQIPEGFLSKVICKIEDEIKKDPDSIPFWLNKLADVAGLLNDPLYSERIVHLSSSIDHDPIMKKEFMSSVNDVGLYFEAPNFANFKDDELNSFVKRNFDIKANEDLLYSREMIEYMHEQMGLGREKMDWFYNSNACVQLPNKDIIVKDILAMPVYMLKLKQEASSKYSSRDFGSYKSSNRQPQQGRSKGGIIAQGSRLGHMEFDALLAHGVNTATKELRTVKNENKDLKRDLIIQMTNSGEYDMPEAKSKKVSPIKEIIAAQISFINS